jgi:hypothetical protein
MKERIPPAWGSDSLSEFLSQADYNAQVTAANYPDIFRLMHRVDLAFRRAEAVVERDSEWVRLVPRFLLVRTHSTFLTAVRVGMSGQVTESCVLLRAAVEQAWYALHMAKEPNGDSRVEIWLRRNDDDEATRKCKAEFTVKNVCSTHRGLDAPTASELRGIYEQLIDYGAHPNQMGVLTGVKHGKADDEGTYSVGILNPAELPMMATLRLAVAVAVGSLKVFRLIYAERFALASLDREIEALVVELNTRFARFSSRK